MRTMESWRCTVRNRGCTCCRWSGQLSFSKECVCIFQRRMSLHTFRGFHWHCDCHGASPVTAANFLPALCSGSVSCRTFPSGRLGSCAVSSVFVSRLRPELFQREMRSRKAYLHKHLDVVGRPVLVAVAQRHSVLDRRFEESCQMCAWFMEQMLDRLDTVPPPSAGLPQRSSEATEQALGIFDLRGFSPLQADVEFAKFLVDVLYSYYPSRFGRVLLVDAPDVFSSFWETIRPLLHRYSLLVEFVSASDVRRLYFAPGLAPEEFQDS
ncbi:unnamed protein product [Polarella glacialis]|uniref:CRAL-TRIO domain-containing protein n=1 Tax=Polarella glacialis TaxID=89957 RepID=A0A813H357_POLGL|nr:unnamed protein product [Polarella glacialis]